MCGRIVYRTKPKREYYKRYRLVILFTAALVAQVHRMQCIDNSVHTVRVAYAVHRNLPVSVYSIVAVV